MKVWPHIVCWRNSYGTRLPLKQVQGRVGWRIIDMKQMIWLAHMGILVHRSLEQQRGVLIGDPTPEIATSCTG